MWGLDTGLQGQWRPWRSGRLSLWTAHVPARAWAHLPFAEAKRVPGERGDIGFL